MLDTCEVPIPFIPEIVGLTVEAHQAAQSTIQGFSRYPSWVARLRERGYSDRDVSLRPPDHEGFRTYFEAQGWFVVMYRHHDATPYHTARFYLADPDIDRTISYLKSELDGE